MLCNLPKALELAKVELGLTLGLSDLALLITTFISGEVSGRYVPNC